MDGTQTYWAKIDWALNKDTGAGVVQGITIPEAREWLCRFRDLAAWCVLTGE